MSGYVDRLIALRDALRSDRWPHPPYRPGEDALLRRMAERLPDELVDDVVALITLARGNQ